ncbi:uncharacterized protein MYCFIDRAFT_180244 [Pseudocercospora fijiensis CIRAD86]|uniref:Uncharacterized protein n=1 Tax=Pseudocercospora fijiensis (strain CIRAD86) TaxID=383855 RepID=M2ZDA8_PSEFD|nr:uncharacterized protein MYCFIDRAFT_180244 [Pseudocercospora fijiensis CIRAD86]EME77099.1 hypothetical protein MYCFIDRAFT_180244 [Pseudocercospora fijiensis CIRAD86]
MFNLRTHIPVGSGTKMKAESKPALPATNRPFPLSTAPPIASMVKKAWLPGSTAFKSIPLPLPPSLPSNKVKVKVERMWRDGRRAKAKAKAGRLDGEDVEGRVQGEGEGGGQDGEDLEARVQGGGDGEVRVQVRMQEEEAQPYSHNCCRAAELEQHLLWLKIEHAAQSRLTEYHLREIEHLQSDKADLQTHISNYQKQSDQPQVQSPTVLPISGQFPGNPHARKPPGRAKGAQTRTRTPKLAAGARAHSSAISAHPHVHDGGTSRSAGLNEQERLLKRRESEIEYAIQRKELAEQLLEKLRQQDQRKLTDGWKPWDAAAAQHLKEEEKEKEMLARRHEDQDHDQDHGMEKASPQATNDDLLPWLHLYLRTLAHWRQHTTHLLNEHRGELFKVARSNSDIAHSVLQDVGIFQQYFVENGNSNLDMEMEMPGVRTLAEEMRGRERSVCSGMSANGWVTFLEECEGDSAPMHEWHAIDMMTGLLPPISSRVQGVSGRAYSGMAPSKCPVSHWPMSCEGAVCVAPQARTACYRCHDETSHEFSPSKCPVSHSLMSCEGAVYVSPQARITCHRCDDETSASDFFPYTRRIQHLLTTMSQHERHAMDVMIRLPHILFQIRGVFGIARPGMSTNDFCLTFLSKYEEYSALHVLELWERHLLATISRHFLGTVGAAGFRSHISLSFPDAGRYGSPIGDCGIPETDTNTTISPQLLHLLCVKTVTVTGLESVSSLIKDLGRGQEMENSSPKEYITISNTSGNADLGRCWGEATFSERGSTTNNVEIVQGPGMMCMNLERSWRKCTFPRNTINNEAIDECLHIIQPRPSPPNRLRTWHVYRPGKKLEQSCFLRATASRGSANTPSKRSTINNPGGYQDGDCAIVSWSFQRTPKSALNEYLSREGSTTERLLQCIGDPVGGCLHITQPCPCILLSRMNANPQPREAQATTLALLMHLSQQNRMQTGHNFNFHSLRQPKEVNAYTSLGLAHVSFSAKANASPLQLELPPTNPIALSLKRHHLASLYSLLSASSLILSITWQNMASRRRTPDSIGTALLLLHPINTALLLSGSHIRRLTRLLRQHLIHTNLLLSRSCIPYLALKPACLPSQLIKLAHSITKMINVSNLCEVIRASSFKSELLNSTPNQVNQTTTYASTTYAWLARIASADRTPAVKAAQLHASQHQVKLGEKLSIHTTPADPNSAQLAWTKRTPHTYTCIQLILDGTLSAKRMLAAKAHLYASIKSNYIKPGERLSCMRATTQARREPQAPTIECQHLKLCSTPTLSLASTTSTPASKNSYPTFRPNCETNANEQSIMPRIRDGILAESHFSSEQKSGIQHILDGIPQSTIPGIRDDTLSLAEFSDLVTILILREISPDQVNNVQVDEKPLTRRGGIPQNDTTPTRGHVPRTKKNPIIPNPLAFSHSLILNSHLQPPSASPKHAFNSPATQADSCAVGTSSRRAKASDMASTLELTVATL